MTRGQRLREARKKLGFTQSEIEMTCQISQKEISMLETDRRESIPSAYIEWMGDVNVNLNYIFLGKGDPFTKESYLHGQKSIQLSPTVVQGIISSLTEMAKVLDKLQNGTERRSKK